MKWIEISVTTNEVASEAIAELLMSKGANGTEMVDPLAFRQVLESNKYLDYADDGFIESYGTDVIVRAYYSDDRDPVALSEEVRLGLSDMNSYLDTAPGQVQWVIRSDEEWKDTWKQYYKPFKFTQRVVIKPSWEDYSPQPEDIVIELDPGMAFGTGTHETTRMCALLGEKHLKAGEKVLDLGCGTAILAISAAKLGAASALAVDIDDAAVKAARQNVENNGESTKIEVRLGELHQLPKQAYDLIFINIIADVIIALSQDVRDYMHENTRVILSGIIKSRQNEVKEAYTALGFKIIDELAMGEWVAMVLHA
ncbi:MAG: 50S ribosomal protein L11 methyltransferase [Clostridia bacterium]|nr:50S ribosomal protein L11 methyltransferase [Clostridia bacterium]